MRLEILTSGHRFNTKILFAFLRILRRPVSDLLKLMVYRPDFYPGAMRGPSAWSVGDRELMAAFVSKMNECPFCLGAHTTTAERAYRDEVKVAAVLTNLETAPIEEPLRATLHMLRKLTRENEVHVNDMRAVLSAGVSREQIEDALAVCFSFNTINRLADAFDFIVLDSQGFESLAKFILTRGYR